MEISATSAGNCRNLWRSAATWDYCRGPNRSIQMRSNCSTVLEPSIVAGTQGEPPTARNKPVGVSIRLWEDGEHWSPWYVDGRAAISGWRSTPESKQTSFAAMRIDPGALLFGPGVERLQVSSVKPIPAAEGWEGEFIHGTGMSPPWADEAIGWLKYKESLERRKMIADEIGMAWSFFSPALMGTAITATGNVPGHQPVQSASG